MILLNVAAAILLAAALWPVVRGSMRLNPLLVVALILVFVMNLAVVLLEVLS